MKINNLNDFISPMPDLSGYKSPITMIVGEMETKMEADTMSVIQRYGIDVNKDELIKALNYERQQYDVGYKDGYNKGFQVAIEMVKQNIDKAIGEALEKQRQDYTEAISDIASKINGGDDN